MIVDPSVLDKTPLRKYLRRQATSCFIAIGIALVLTILGGVFTKKWDYLIGMFVMILMYQVMELQQVQRTYYLMRAEIARALFNSINIHFDRLVNYWGDYNIPEAVKTKAQWDAIVTTASIMKEQSLIPDEVYKYILETNISYTTKETKIRLDNMRNK